MKRKKGFYSISVVAKMFSVHQQTVRLYEKEGLITPMRSAGNTRLFSEEDLDRLEQIIYLTHKVGVNLAGVEIILKQQKKLKRLQGEINKLFTQTSAQMDEETEVLKQEVKQATVNLIAMKPKNAKGPVPESSGHQKNRSIFDDQEDEISEDSWKLDYED